jgi:signal transduction histidine kinase
MVDRSGEILDVVISPARLIGQSALLLVILDLTHVRQIEREVLDHTESERREIGKEIHDGLGQTLTGIALMVEVLGRKLAKQGLKEADVVQDLARLVNEAVEQTRHLARRVDPVLLTKRSLQDSLEQLARSVETLHDVPCFFEGDQEIRITDSFLAAHLYWIAQEGLKNVIQHDHPQSVTLSLLRDGDKVVLGVAYNGPDLSTDWEEHLERGWRRMLYRATMIGAALRLEQVGEDGARLLCVLDKLQAEAKGNAESE